MWMVSLILLILEKFMFLMSGGTCTHCLMARAKKRLNQKCYYFLKFHLYMDNIGGDQNHGRCSRATLLSGGLSGDNFWKHQII